MLSPLYQALVYLESHGHLKRQDFSIWSNKKFRGVVGKLEVQGWINKQIHDREFAYTLSAQGRNWINQQLKNIHQEEPIWDKKYRIIVFTFKEENRTLRDKLRRELRELGFAPYEKGMWFSLFDQKAGISKLAQELGINQNFAYFEANFLDGSQPEILKKAWPINQIKSDYKKFIAEAKKLILRFSNLRDAHYQIKKLILAFTLVLKQDPLLPEEVLPSNWPKKEAFRWYQKLRDKLYSS